MVARHVALEGDATRRITMSSTILAKNEFWAYGYDDMGQLTSATANFLGSGEPEIPGSLYGYAYDDIGNRTSATFGQTGDTYSITYSANKLNQYTAVSASPKIEVSGYSPAPAVLVDDGTTTWFTATRFTDSQSPPNLLYDGFFHTRLTAPATPSKVPVTISEVTGSTVTNSDYEVYVGDGKAPSYDADGNVLNDGVWMYEWDAENRLTAMTLDEEIADFVLGQNQLDLRLEFRYDYMGRRISKRVMRSGDELYTITDPKNATWEWGESSWQKFIYDGWNLSVVLDCDAEDGTFDSSTVAQTFAWGPDLSGTEQGAGGIGGLAIYVDDGWDLTHTPKIGPMFPVYDGNGNVIRVYDSSADSNGVPAKQAEYKYGPFGEDRGRTGPIEASRFPFRWSTKYTDNETGLVYYGYRYYSPSTGKWVTRDPLLDRAFATGNRRPKKRHIYSYDDYFFASNRPVDRFDALGLISGCPCGPNIDYVILDHLNAFVSQPAGDAPFTGYWGAFTFDPPATNNAARIRAAATSVTGCGIAPCDGTYTLGEMCISGFHIRHVLWMAYLAENYGEQDARDLGYLNESFWYWWDNEGSNPAPTIPNDAWANADVRMNDVALCLARKMAHIESSEPNRGVFTDLLLWGELRFCTRAAGLSGKQQISMKPSMTGRTNYWDCDRCGQSTPDPEEGLVLPPIEPD